MDKGEVVEEVVDRREVVEEGVDGGEVVEKVVDRGGGGRGRGWGRGCGGGQATTSGRGRGRSAGKGRGGKHAEPSSLPWQPVDPGKDAIPSPLSFCVDVGSTLQMPPGSKPVDYYRQLIDDRVIHLIVEETNK